MLCLVVLHCDVGVSAMLQQLQASTRVWSTSMLEGASAARESINQVWVDCSQPVASNQLGHAMQVSCWLL